MSKKILYFFVIIIGVNLICTDSALAAKSEKNDTELIQIRDHISQLKDDTSTIKSNLKKITSKYKDYLENKYDIDGLIEVIHCQAKRGFLFDQQKSGWNSIKKSILEYYHEKDLEGLCGEENFERKWRNRLNSTILMNTEHITIFSQEKIAQDVYYKLLLLEIEQNQLIFEMNKKMKPINDIIQSNSSSVLDLYKGQLLIEMKRYLDTLKLTYSKDNSKLDSHLRQMVKFRLVAQIQARIHQQDGTDQMYGHLNEIKYADSAIALNIELLTKRQQRKISKKRDKLPPLPNVDIKSNDKLEIIEGSNESAEIALDLLNKVLDHLKDAEDHLEGIHEDIEDAYNDIKDLHKDIVDDWNKYRDRLRKAIEKERKRPNRNNYVLKERRNRTKISEKRTLIRKLKSQLVFEKYDEVKMIYSY